MRKLEKKGIWIFNKIKVNILKDIRENKLGFSIYIILFIFLLISLLLWSTQPCLYPISFFIILSIFLLSQYFCFRSIYFIGFSLFILIICLITLLVLDIKFTKYIAKYVYAILFLGILGFFLDNLRDKLREKGYIKIYKIFFLSIFILLIIMPTFSGANYFRTIQSRYYRNFQSDLYYSSNEDIVTDDKITKENIEIAIDYPKEGDSISGEFILEGWAIGHNSYLEESVVDIIEVFIDGKPGVGKFIGMAKPNILRKELGEIYGEQHKNCGFRLYLNSYKFKNGRHTIYVYANNKFGWDYISFDINIGSFAKSSW